MKKGRITNGKHTSQLFLVKAVIKPIANVNTTTQSQIDFSFRHFRIKRLEIINYLVTKKVLISASSPMNAFTTPRNGRGRRDEMCTLLRISSFFLLSG